MPLKPRLIDDRNLTTGAAEDQFEGQSFEAPMPLWKKALLSMFTPESMVPGPQALSMESGAMLQRLLNTWKGGPIVGKNLTRIQKLVENAFSAKPNISGKFELSPWSLRAFGKGTPGFSSQPMDGSYAFVYRNAEGNPLAFTEFDVDKAGKLIPAPTGSLYTFVHPSVRGQGIASTLYDMAEAAGYPIDQVSGYAVYDAGNKLAKNRFYEKLFNKYGGGFAKSVASGRYEIPELSVTPLVDSIPRADRAARIADIINFNLPEKVK